MIGKNFERLPTEWEGYGVAKVFSSYEMVWTDWIDHPHIGSGRPGRFWHDGFLNGPKTDRFPPKHSRRFLPKREPPQL